MLNDSRYPGPAARHSDTEHHAAFRWETGPTLPLSWIVRVRQRIQVQERLCLRIQPVYRRPLDDLTRHCWSVYDGVELDGIAVLLDPMIRKVGWFPSEAPRLRTRGLETISVARRNGRGPDSSLISPCTSACTCRSLTDNLNHSISSREWVWFLRHELQAGTAVTLDRIKEVDNHQSSTNVRDLAKKRT